MQSSPAWAARQRPSRSPHPRTVFTLCNTALIINNQQSITWCFKSDVCPKLNTYQYQHIIMTNIRNEILNWIGNKTVTTDELHDFIKSKLSDSYEIGDAGEIINDMIAEELLMAKDFELKRND